MVVHRRLLAGVSGREAQGKVNRGHKVGEREGTPEALRSHQPAGHEVRAGQRGLDWRGSSGRTGKKSEEEGWAGRRPVVTHQDPGLEERFGGSPGGGSTERPEGEDFQWRGYLGPRWPVW